MTKRRTLRQRAGLRIRELEEQVSKYGSPRTRKFYLSAAQTQASYDKSVALHEKAALNKTKKSSPVGFFGRIHRHFKTTACKYLPGEKRKWCEKHESNVARNEVVNSHERAATSEYF